MHRTTSFLWSISVLFGLVGLVGSLGFTPSAVADVCESAWSEMTPSGPSPAPRLMHAMAYHPLSGKTVVFAGSNGSSGSAQFGDTWLWDGVEWTDAGVLGPAARYLPAIANHGGTGNLVLFGGFDGGPEVYLNDTWRWDGVQWAQANPAGPIPQRRGYIGMAYHEPSDRVVLYGGASDVCGPCEDTWVWDGTNWSQVAMTGSTPGPRAGHAMAYDSVTGMVLLHGGWDTSAGSPPWPVDTWGWDGTEWHQLATTGPTDRLLAAMSPDPSRDTVLLFGGEEPNAPTWHSANGSTLVGDTWEWCQGARSLAAIRAPCAR